jgi:hypothetical protein
MKQNANFFNSLSKVIAIKAKFIIILLNNITYPGAGMKSSDVINEIYSRLSLRQTEPVEKLGVSFATVNRREKVGVSLRRLP